MKELFIKDIRSESPCGGNGWCFAVEILRHAGWSERTLTQLRLMYDLRWMESRKQGYDVGKDYAEELFVKQYAAKFAKVYKEDMTHAEVFELIFQQSYPGKSCGCSTSQHSPAQESRAPESGLATI